jgi:hypothetical protein
MRFSPDCSPDPSKSKSSPKMKITLILTSLLALAGLAQAGPRVPFGTGELPEVMKPYDVDADGKLNAEERQAFVKAMRDKKKTELLEKFDTNGDGVLSSEELAAARDAARQKIEDRRLSRFTELDKDANGSLSPTEFAPPGNLPAELVANLFDHLDANDDGAISKEEFLAGCRRPGERPTPPAPPAPPAPPVPPTPAG